MLLSKLDHLSWSFRIMLVDDHFEPLNFRGPWNLDERVLSLVDIKWARSQACQAFFVLAGFGKLNGKA